MDCMAIGLKPTLALNRTLCDLAPQFAFEACVSNKWLMKLCIRHPMSFSSKQAHILGSEPCAMLSIDS